MFNQTKFVDKGNGFSLAASEGISDITLMGVATEYKTNVSRKYKTLPARLIDQTFQGVQQVFSSIKYDGEAVYIFFDAATKVCTAFNAPSGRARIGLPCLVEVEEKLTKAGIKKALFVGEIYLKGDSRTQVGDVIHVTFNGSKQEREQLTLAVYDVIMLDGKDLRDQQNQFEKSLTTLKELFGSNTADKAHTVEGQILPGSGVKNWFTKVTQELGQEGIVVRNLTNHDIYKIKPSITVDAVVIGFVEGDFEGMYGVTSLLCGLYDKSSHKIQSLTRVGSGFSDEQRVQLLDSISKLKVSSPLDMTDSDGRPISFVKPQIVIEVEGESLVKENFHGKENTSQTFLWEDNQYTFLGINPFPLLTHATFARFRDDKVWDDGGTRMEQVISAPEIAALSAQKESSGTPEVVTREVYTKVTKGETAVRKILLIKTNQPNAFEYAVHWTDFSPNRAEPLKTETKVASDKTRANELVEAYQKEAQKKGWEKAA